MEIIEGHLKFLFPENVKAQKYDEMLFYRNHFNSAFNGTKAVDILCYDQERAWLIEVKDYRYHERTKSIDLPTEIALKVRDTLAGIICMKANSNSFDEQLFAKNFLKSEKLRIILHLEQPKNKSKLFPESIDISKLKQKMKPLLKSVDPHFIIMSKDKSSSAISWNVKSISES